MIKLDLKEVIKRPEYNFINEEPNLGENLMFLTLGGSHAYGTNVEGSDIDVRGVALERKEVLLGMSNFEQFINNPTDTTIYGFKKFINLCMACNPNIIEMLGGTEEQYVNVSPEGKLLLENKHIFLSQRAVNSFGGYANAQLRRLQNAVARDRVDTPEKLEHVIKTMLFAIPKIASKFDLPDDAFIVKKSQKADDNGLPQITLAPGPGFNELVFNDSSLVKIHGFCRELDAIKTSYEKDLSGRNRRAAQKSDKQLNKHAMHLIRLYLMAFDILEKGEINTFRDKDRDFLLEIRSGKYMNDEGLYVPEFFDMVSEYEKRLNYAAANTSLPKKPDAKKIEELMLNIYAQKYNM